MSRRVHWTAAAAMLLFAALTLVQCSQKETQLATKAPYLTDVAQALAEAARSGKNALLYFYSDT
jgi:hypothetical protein